MRGTGPSESRSNRGRALLLLDLTVDRLHRDGAWPVPMAATIRRFVEGELAYFRERGRPVIHLVTRFDAEEPLLGELPRHNLRGTPGAEFADAFAPRPDEVVIEKRVDNAFVDTELAARLAELDVAQISLAGVETHAAVLTTAIEAWSRGFHVIVPDTCVADCDEELHESALRLIRANRWLRRTATPAGPDAPGP